MSKIEIANLNLYYDDFQALKNVNLNIEANRITAFIGPSGCGKSTLLKTLNRMARVDEDGFIYLVDRKKDVIISGGENLYPVQIEDYLRQNGKIKDVAVIGMMLAYYQRVYLRLRVNVIKRVSVRILINLMRRDFPPDNFAEQAIVHGQAIAPSAIVPADPAPES